MSFDALTQLVALRNDCFINRAPGWDLRARSEAIAIVVRHHFGTVMDTDTTATEAFLDVLIHLIEEEGKVGA